MKTCIRPVAGIFLLTSLAANTYSADQSYFGVDLFSGSGEFERESSNSDYSNATFDVDVDGTSYLFGFDLENDNHFEFKFTEFDLEYEDNSKASFKELDFDWGIGFAHSEVARPYGLIGFGLAIWEDTAEYFETGQDLKGLALNLGIGSKFHVHQNIALDLSYRYKAISWQEVESYSGTEYSYSHSLSSIQLGARVLF